MKKMIYTFPGTEESVTIVSDLPEGFNARNLRINGEYVDLWDQVGDDEVDAFFDEVTGREYYDDPFDDRWSEDFTEKELHALTAIIKDTFDLVGVRTEVSRWVDGSGFEYTETIADEEASFDSIDPDMDEIIQRDDIVDGVDFRVRLTAYSVDKYDGNVVDRLYADVWASEWFDGERTLDWKPVDA